MQHVNKSVLRYTCVLYNNLYHKVSPAGYVIVDDYGESTWTYCKEAVDEFRLKNKISSPLISVDSSCVYWRK